MTEIFPSPPLSSLSLSFSLSLSRSYCLSVCLFLLCLFPSPSLSLCLSIFLSSPLSPCLSQCAGYCGTSAPKLICRTRRGSLILISCFEGLSRVPGHLPLTVSVDPTAGEIRRVLQGEADNKGRDKGGREREREREREMLHTKIERENESICDWEGRD